MNEECLIRKATVEDIKFLVEVIIGAEKSNTDKLSLSTFFNLSESRVGKLLMEILKEEIDGCEFSVSSFLIAEFHGKQAAAVGGWIEAIDNEIPSQTLKSNLIGYFFPGESIRFLQSKSSIIKDIQIKRDSQSLQIEYVYVSQLHRGFKLAEKLINEHIKSAVIRYPAIKKAQVQVFKNNISAIKLYERLDFTTTKEFISDNDCILDYVPYFVKLLMEKKLN